MSFNIWHQGAHGGIGVVVDRIRASGANVVALSETGGGATEAVADALGWQHTEPGWDIDVISALPIEDTDWKSWSDTGAQAIAAKIAEWTGSGPGIVAGDLNSPSHQDWTAAAAASHCGYTVDWPTTRAFTDRGFTDSFRRLRPDPVAEPGNTWSPVVKDNEGRPEPQDRIDYVFYRGFDHAHQHPHLRRR